MIPLAGFAFCKVCRNVDPLALLARHIAVRTFERDIDKAGDLYSALTKMSASNTARPAIDLITDAVLTAALPLLEAEKEDTP